MTISATRILKQIPFNLGAYETMDRRDRKFNLSVFQQKDLFAPNQNNSKNISYLSLRGEVFLRGKNLYTFHFVQVIRWV